MFKTFLVLKLHREVNYRWELTTVSQPPVAVEISKADEQNHHVIKFNKTVESLSVSTLAEIFVPVWARWVFTADDSYPV